jgi:2-polyprenyl-3-methyl-5-hydroxy-6-metoxy-1,4-benzoquinol methylase
VNLRELPAALAARTFDLVFSFGLLHHTGDTRRALANVASLVDSEGVLFCISTARARSTSGDGWRSRPCGGA